MEIFGDRRFLAVPPLLLKSEYSYITITWCLTIDEQPAIGHSSEHFGCCTWLFFGKKVILVTFPYNLFLYDVLVPTTITTTPQYKKKRTLIFQQ